MKEFYRSAVVAFGRHRQDSLTLKTECRFTDRDVPEERVQRREAVVPCPRGVLSCGFEMVEKCAQERDIEFLDAERRRGSSQCRRREAEEETKGIAVKRRNRMGTGPELTEQPIREEPLEEGRKDSRAHCPPPACRPLRESVARWSNSAILGMYQYVCATSLCPRDVDSVGNSRVHVPAGAIPLHERSRRKGMARRPATSACARSGVQWWAQSHCVG